MTSGPRFRRTRVRSLWALLALVGVLWLNAEPHRHADERDERSCAACQVARGDGQAAPERAIALAPPSAVANRPAGLAPTPVEAARRDGPPPGRGPPVALS